MRTELINEVTLDTPISVQEARLHLRNPENTEDSEIVRFIQAARGLTEHKLGRNLTAQLWDVWLDAFPEKEIELPFGPLASVSYVKYTDGDNVLQTVSTDTYRVDKSGPLGRVILAYSKIWPRAATGLDNAVNIRFIAGYPNPDAIPQAIKHYMKLLISEFNANRELTTERPVSLTPWAERLLDPYRVDFVI
jgi:uncharacterized phiE125 gp8 family phage protein